MADLVREIEENDIPELKSILLKVFNDTTFISGIYEE